VDIVFIKSGMYINCKRTICRIPSHMFFVICSAECLAIA
jgi:hypothetical protein